MGNTWWYVSNGQKHGPIEQNELARLILAGTIEQNTLLWKTGMSGWQALKQIEELQALCAYAPPPLPPSISPSPPPLSAALGAHERQPVTPASVPPAAAAAPDKPTTQEKLEKPKPRAFKRFFARTFDLWWEIILVIAVSFVVMYLGFSQNLFQKYVNLDSVVLMLIVTVLPVALIFDAFIYKIFGNTPGKALLGLKVTESNGVNLSFDDYFTRNMRLWVEGLWLGFPLVKYIPMLIQSHRLHNGLPASYDAKDNYLVSGKPVGWVKTLAFIILFGLLLLVQLAMGLVDVMNKSRHTSNQISAPTTQNANPPVAQTPSPPAAQHSTLEPTDAREQFALAMKYYNGEGIP